MHLVLISSLAAQVDCNFTLGNDTSICQGQQMVLTAPPGPYNLLWSTGATTPTIIVSSPGTYSLTVNSGAGSQLVLNGDFSTGNTGFTSAYEFSTTIGQYGLLSDEGQYVVGTDPQDAHYDFASCGDHTTGNGNMMVVNGAATPDVPVWCQTVSVEPNQNYSFSAWLMTAFPNNPASLEFSINGVTIGAPLTASATTCVWEQFAAQWDSGTATSAEICIVNQNTVIFGNDFSLDDISFTTQCSFTASINVDVGQDLVVDLGLDQNICDGMPIILDPGFPDAEIVWQDGSTDATYTVTESGTYSVTVSQNGCSGSDEVLVEMVTGPTVEITGDTLLCDTLGIVLTANASSGAITWQDGSTAAEFIVFGPGMYSVIVEEDGCTASDQVQVIEGTLPVIELSEDTVLCEMAPVTLMASGTLGALITWQDGSEGPLFVAADPGEYHASISNQCGTAIDSVQISFASFPEVEDVAVCPGETVTISLDGMVENIVWSNGSEEATVELPEGEHGFDAVDTLGCPRAGFFMVFVDAGADGEVYVPNSFTPNGDGINDLFKVEGAEHANYALEIFDRWGHSIFESHDPMDGWDGTRNGELVPVGVFVYTLHYRDSCSGIGMQQRMGHVSLLR